MTLTSTWTDGCERRRVLIVRPHWRRALRSLTMSPSPTKASRRTPPRCEGKRSWWAVFVEIASSRHFHREFHGEQRSLCSTPTREDYLFRPKFIAAEKPLQPAMGGDLCELNCALLQQSSALAFRRIMRRLHGCILFQSEIAPDHFRRCQLQCIWLIRQRTRTLPLGAQFAFLLLNALKIEWRHLAEVTSILMLAFCWRVGMRKIHVDLSKY